MNKGVKKIGARNSDKGPSFLEGGRPGTYFVTEWYPKTKEQEKNNVRWFLRYKDELLFRETGPEVRFTIPKHNCGGIPYILSACLSGSREKEEAYVNITGYCDELVRSGQWAKEEKGSKVILSAASVPWGVSVEIHVETEGLNGYFLALEVYALKGSKPSEKNDFLLDSHTGECIDGRLEYIFPNTDSWFNKLKAAKKLKAEQKVYIRVKWMGTRIKNEKGEDHHACFLCFKNVLPPNHRSSKPENTTILRIGEQEGDPAEYDHCTFSGIDVIDYLLDLGIPMVYTVFQKGRVRLNKERNFIKKLFVYFDFDRFNLRPDAMRTIDMHTEFIKNRNLTVKLEGHTDNRGTERYNENLGYDRAVSVGTYLKKKGVDPDNIRIVSFGEYRPIHEAETEKQHAENRRVEISFDVYETEESAIKYDTIAPPPGDEKRKLDLWIFGFTNKGCLKEGKHVHPAETIWIDHDGKKTQKPLILLERNTIAQEIYSKMHTMDFLGVLLANPNLLTGIFGGISFWEDHLKVLSNTYAMELHSCAYYSVSERNTLLINAYPDTWVANHFQFNFKEDYFFREHPVSLIKGMEGIEEFFRENIGKYLETPDPIVPDINKIILEVLMKWIRENIDKFKSGVHAYHTICNQVPKHIIDYSEKYRTYMEINHIIFGLYLFVIEILLIIVTRGAGALGKLNSWLKKFKWIKALNETKFFKLGPGMQDPQIALNTGGYYEKMLDGRVAYMYQFNFKAAPLLGMDLSFSMDIQKPVKKGAGGAAKSVTDNPLFEEFLKKIVGALNLPEAKVKVSLIGSIGFEVNIVLNTLTHEVTWQDMTSDEKKKNRLNTNQLLLRPEGEIKIKIEFEGNIEQTHKFEIKPLFWKEPLLEVTTESKLSIKADASGSVVLRRMHTFGSNPYFTDYLFFTGFECTFFQKIESKVKGSIKSKKKEKDYDSNPDNKKHIITSPEKLIPLWRLDLFPPKFELLIFK